MPITVGIISLLLTGAAAFLLIYFLHAKHEVRFNSLADERARRVSARLETTITLLRGAVGLFHSSVFVSRDEFRSYVRGLNLEDHYPGIQAVGFASRVAAPRKEESITEMRSSVEVWFSDLGEETYVVSYVEPVDERNQRAFEYDMKSETSRREAMERARDTGLPTGTGGVRLVQETDSDVQPGYLIVLPVYLRPMAKDAPVEERRRNLKGFVFSALLMNDFFSAFLERDTYLPQVMIYDGDEVRPEKLLYSSVVPRGNPEHEPVWNEQVVTVIAGRSWLLNFVSTPQFEADSDLSWILLVVMVGIAGSSLLFGMAWHEQRTQKKILQANRELLDLNRMKSEFTAMVSHELRTPLSAIKAALELMVEGVEGPVNAEQRETLDMAAGNVNRLQRLISDILDYGRIECGGIEFRFEKCDLTKIVRDVQETMTLVARQKRQELVVEMPEQPVMLKCDGDRIKQVLINLIDNALKFSFKGGEIFVSVNLDDDAVRIEVSDSGIGISPEDRCKLFKMYGQSLQGARYRGTGIGLAVCKMIIDGHGGTIDVISKSGEGATFRVRIPIDGD